MGILLVLIPALVIVAAIRSARGTTLVAPLTWAAVAYVLTSYVATQLETGSGADRSKWMFIAATSTLCPCVALFGAKRPQNGAWQFIVGAFWFVMALPAIQGLLFHAGEPLEVHVIWKWALAILIAAGCANYVPTRFGWAALVFAFGQVQLFWDHLLWTPTTPLMIGRAAGIGLLILGILMVHLNQRIAKRRLTAYRGWNRTWIDFRDCYGAVWALRVMERVGSLPAALSAGVRLSWDGFYEVQSINRHESCNTVDADGVQFTDESPPLPNSIEIRTASPVVLAPLDASLRNLLRRFVSKQWLDARLRIEPP